uniref:Uncharacterized protein n=1 Tax=Triticum urartu TaxID=4572 RepID=A0A8R7VK38_TRIUA
MIRLHTLLKNTLPFFPIPVPTRLAARRDLLSGLHFSSLRLEKSSESAPVISSSFILLHATTCRLCKSFHEVTTDSTPRVVNNEQPSKDSNFTLLHRPANANMSSSRPQQFWTSNSRAPSQTKKRAWRAWRSRSWQGSSSILAHP